MKRSLAIFAAAILSAPLAAAADPGIDTSAVAPDKAPVQAVAVQPGAGPVVVVVTPAAPVAEQPLPPERVSRPEVVLGVGVRGSILRSAGFDPYLNTDFFAQSSLLAGLTIVRAGPASIGLFANWDFGARNAMARGQEASLAMHRLVGGAETRLYLHRRFFFDAKLAGVAYHLRGAIQDTSLDRPLVSRTWTWGLDVSGGMGVVLTGVRGGGPRLYLTLDLGYTFAGDAAMSYAPTEDAEDTRKYGSVRLPSIKPSGATSRLGIALGF